MQITSLSEYEITFPSELEIPMFSSIELLLPIQEFTSEIISQLLKQKPAAVPVKKVLIEEQLSFAPQNPEPQTEVIRK